MRWQTQTTTKAGNCSENRNTALSSNFSTVDGVEWAAESRDDVLSLNLVKVAAVEEAVKPPKERSPLP